MLAVKAENSDLAFWALQNVQFIELIVELLCTITLDACMPGCAYVVMVNCVGCSVDRCHAGVSCVGHQGGVRLRAQKANSI